MKKKANQRGTKKLCQIFSQRRRDVDYGSRQSDLQQDWTTNGGDAVRAQNVSGLELPKPPQGEYKKKEKQQKLLHGSAQPESNLNAPAAGKPNFS